MKTIAIIPALNEAENIADVVRETLKQPVDEVIVVDNGSTDDTGILAQQVGATVITETRRGYGYACAAGVAAATADILVFLDGDFSTLPSEIRSLIEPVLAGQAQLVLGSRMLGQVEPGAMAPHQHFGNWLSAYLIRLLYNLPISDLSPFRAVEHSKLRSLEMQEMTYGWPTEMIAKAARKNWQITEIPVNYFPRYGGKSKISGTLRGTVLATYYILTTIIKYAR